MATPAKPRQSGIPGPGRASSIPTPGRSRSSSNVHQNIQTSEDISRAFADAIKANDPSMHRGVSLVNSASASSLSPQSVAFSGRRSVAGGRPSSAASTSSTKVQERAKTPSSARISSRPPSRSEISKPPRAFEVGDNVRIESLGFEGTLRYVGDIEGKPGLWAGIELSGGFSGKGKNNGSVGGTQYFRCPDKCGVFVATTKLSAPTVGPGAVQRPSSVASFKGGQITPANSGRVTPSIFSGSRTPSASFSNGRITPSTGGRVTPSHSTGRITPSVLAGISMQQPFKTPTSKKNGPSLSDKITAGSRASKYMAMTAQQLSTRDHQLATDSSTHRTNTNTGFSTFNLSSASLSSPSRPSGSPFTTPRAGSMRPSITGGNSPTLPSNRGRVSMNTPRARIPSGVAMPPPPSPKIIQSSHSHTATDYPSSPSSHAESLLDEKKMATASFLSSRPSSSASFSSNDEISMAEQLQSRLDAAEYEIDRLRAAMDTNAENLVSDELESLKKELRESIVNSAGLEDRLSEAQGLLTSQGHDLQVLQKDNEDLKRKLVEITSQAEENIAARESESQTHALEMKSLTERINEFQQLTVQKDQANAAQALNIEELSANIDKAYSDFQEERKELYVQIDELRIAGQETIALYEERLSIADSQRYELEHRISILDANLKAVTTDPASPASREPPSNVTSAALIDNETLRDQIQHLQRKSAKLEEQLEETRATLERDVVTYQDKISRIRLEEEQYKRDITFKSREVEQLVKSETSARNRIEEIEEAFRESTVALEITRGEVEALRAEMANLDILIDDASEADISSKLANFTKKIGADKAKYRLEISQLEQNLSEALAEKDFLMQQVSNNSSIPSDELQETADLLSTANDSLRKQVAELEDKVLVMTQELEDRTAELDTARKKSNRDAPLLNGTSESFNLNTGKPEPSTETLAGLKHIVQELQKENLAAAQQIKLLQSENRLLSTEAEQLRQEVNILEENLDNTIDEENLDNNKSKAARPLADQRIRLETDSELEQMRKRLNESEMKHARITHGLNKEISELEALVEAKIYREDELEQEVERLKDKLSRQKKSSKTNGESAESRNRLSTASSSTGTSELGPSQKEVCEICERPGHDIFNCSLLKDDKKGVVCEDCESPGHVAADCPHSLDVF